MRPLAQILMDLLEREPLTVHELVDLTGRSPEYLEETLVYLEGFGLVDHEYGYWTLSA